MIIHEVGSVQLWIGECAEENDVLVRSAKPGWWWFHASDGPSAHAVLRTSAMDYEQCRVCADLLRAHMNKKSMRVDMVCCRHIRLTEVPGCVRLLRGPRSTFIVAQK